MKDLPADREKALEAIAKGWGRTPTAAHPLCRCGKPYLPTCSFCNAKPGKPCRPQYDGDTLHHGRRERYGTARDCPMHRP